MERRGSRGGEGRERIRVRGEEYSFSSLRSRGSCIRESKNLIFTDTNETEKADYEESSSLHHSETSPTHFHLWPELFYDRTC